MQTRILAVRRASQAARRLGLSGIAALALASATCLAAAEPAPPASLAAVATPAPSPTTGTVRIEVLSSRYDLVSGGDALVRITASDGAHADQLRLALNGRDLQQKLTYDPRANTLTGVVGGLGVGVNWLQAIGPTGASVSQALVNYPITGPILSGPHLTPYECRTEESGLGAPLDADCSTPRRIEWFYRSTGGAFKPLDKPKIKPDDLAMTTTIEGRTVPYVVRVESGTINRSIYRIAVLDDPSTPEILPSEGWNGRLAVVFGGGCGTAYNQGANKPAAVLSDLYLGRGFAYAASTELVNQLHCNGVLQGETMMMLKEHFIERYGVPKWTVGFGGSGGAIQQLLITEMYPGLLDGLQPSASFPDSALHTPDCGLLEHFFQSKDGAKWPDEKRAAVAGFYGTTCASWARSFVPILDAANKKGCGLNDASLIYDKKTNPKGARCTITDMRVNLYGRDPKTGFARKPDDNVGLQYGLKALNDGVISVDEFLTLNEKIGGNDIDGAFVAKRSVGDPDALKAIYASGTMNTMGGGLGNVPILHTRNYSDSASDIHSRERDLTIRARLEKAYGRSDNQVIWVAGVRTRPGESGGSKVDLSALSLDAMTKWLDAIVADPAPLSTDKVVKHKPAEAVDAYWTEDDRKVVERADWYPESGYNKAYPPHLEPRLVAGAPPANDVMKCQLKPVSMADYIPKFTAAQEKRLKKVFPAGVCDWTKDSVGFSTVSKGYIRY